MPRLGIASGDLVTHAYVDLLGGLECPSKNTEPIA